MIHKHFVRVARTPAKRHIIYEENVSDFMLMITQRSARPGNPKAAASERAVRRIMDLGDLRKLVVAAGGGSWLEGDATILLIR